MTREEWLASLAVGDRVAEVCGRRPPRIFSILEMDEDRIWYGDNPQVLTRWVFRESGQSAGGIFYTIRIEPVEEA